MSPNPFEIHNKASGQVHLGKNIGFEEVLLDAGNSDVLDNERDQVNYRTLSLIALLVLVGLFARIFFLQVIRGPEFRALAEGNKLRIQYVLAPRGLLIDRYGKVIVSNIPSFELAVFTSDLPSDPGLLAEEIANVSEVLGKDPLELSLQLTKMRPDSFQLQTLVENITKDQALILLARPKLPGFVVQDNPIRDYKDALAFTHVTGYTGKITQEELDENLNQGYVLNDYIGKTGLEYQYEDYLRGSLGKKQTEVDAVGDFKKILGEVPAVPGNNVKLNIDYDLQKKIYDALAAQLVRTRTRKAASIATNPKTGEVLALVSLPSFDSNMFARGITIEEFNQLLTDNNNQLLNRVVTGQYPPGSTIKPVMALAALSEGVVDEKTKILDDGVIRIGSFTFYGYERSGLGLMDIYSAIARSSDIYFYTIGGGNPKNSTQGLGPEKIAEWFRKFHLGSMLGIDLPSEKSGLVPDPAWKQQVKNEKWFLGDTYHESIGQGDVLSTPLQVNSWTATIANNGKIMRPYILDEVVDKNDRVLTKAEPKVLAENIFNAEYLSIVQEGMRRAVTEGSGLSLTSLPFEISGKTGTAQFDAKDLSKTHAWFTSYAPSSNPEIALTVLVEGAGEGHAVAVPVVKEIYEWWGKNRMR